MASGARGVDLRPAPVRAATFAGAAPNAAGTEGAIDGSGGAGSAQATISR